MVKTRRNYPGHLFVMPDGELVYQSLAHARVNGEEKGYQHGWLVTDDDSYIASLEEAEEFYGKASTEKTEAGS